MEDGGLLRVSFAPLLQLKEELCDGAVLRHIDCMVEEYAMPLEEDQDVRINYDGFTQVRIIRAVQRMCKPWHHLCR